jgi:hypothetical protein
MLTLNALFSVNESANQLADAGMAAVPVPGSPLDQLTQLCMPLETIGGQRRSDMLDCDVPADLVNCSKYKDLGGNYLHDDAMENFVSLASVIVAKNLDMARNRANPMIKEVVDSAVGYADAKAMSTLSPMNVMVEYYPLPYNCPILGELVSRYSDIPNNDMKLTVIFQPMAAGEIRKNAVTGISRLDEDVMSWLENVSDETVEGIYNDVFGERAKTLNDVMTTLATRPACSLLVFLLARRFKDNIPDGLNIDLGSYKEYVTTLMGQAGRVVASVIRLRADNDRADYMVKSFPDYVDSYLGVPSGQIKVNADVYNRWTKAGGVPEALFGAIHAGETSLNYTKLLGESDRFVEIWRRATALMKTRVEFDRFNHFLEGLRQALLNQVGTMDASLRVFTDQAYKERITDHLARVKEGGVDAPWHVARKLVCRVFFPHTEAEAVLLAIATQVKLNPDMELREAALLATVDIVTTWVAKQFNIQSVAMTPAAMAA